VEKFPSRFDQLEGVFGDHLCDFFIGVVQIPEDPGPPRADLDAGRFQACVDPVLAEVALLDDRNQGIDISCIVRAGGKTILAADTAMFIDDNDAVFPLPGCLDRAVDDAGGRSHWLQRLGRKWRVILGYLPFSMIFTRSDTRQGERDFLPCRPPNSCGSRCSAKIDDHGISFLSVVFFIIF